MKALLVAFTLACTAGVAQAEIQSYECDLHSRQNRGWIPSKVLLSVDAENKRARAYDGAIRASNELANISAETPKDTKFKKTRNGEYRLSWRVTLRAKATGDYRVAYTATLNPQSNALAMRASFPQANASNRPFGEGDCKLVTLESLY
ncbi:hypothetical protein [Ruegeria atlantica]|uniref:hypothetical protein n=1 Tax=Ruegeria atlantica TaxID=81569 RepID=UPI0014809E6B|nr:hypothetical protein [Ruegeria atlantica]